MCAACKAGIHDLALQDGAVHPLFVLHEGREWLHHLTMRSVGLQHFDSVSGIAVFSLVVHGLPSLICIPSKDADIYTNVTSF